jgi:hypothetical protein
MKLKILLLASFLPISSWASSPADTITTSSDKKVVINDIDGTVKVKVYKNNNAEMKQIFEGHYSDNQDVEQYFFSPLIPDKKRQNSKSFSSHLPLFFMGYNDLSSSCFGSLNNANLHTRAAKSWEWGISVVTWDFGLNSYNSSNTGIVIGAQIINVHNHFAGNNVLTTDANDNTFLRDEPKGVKKSYISYWSINIPAMIEYQRKYGHHKLFAAIGASLEIRMNEHSRYFIGNDKYTETNNINLNPFGLNIQGHVGYGDIQIYMRSALTPLLNSGKAPKCYPISIGLGINI